MVSASFQFSPIFACFSAIYIPICPLAEQFGRIAWQNSLVLQFGRTHGPPGTKKFWQEGIEFWQDEVWPLRDMMTAMNGYFGHVHVNYFVQSYCYIGWCVLAAPG